MSPFRYVNLGSRLELFIDFKLCAVGSHKRGTKFTCEYLYLKNSVHTQPNS